MDCAIIGAGPAGLATAIALSKALTSPSIALFERDDFQPKGARIQISKSGWESVKNLDGKKIVGAGNDVDGNDRGGSLVKKLEKTGVPVTGAEIRPWKIDANDSETEGEDATKKRKERSLKKYVISYLLQSKIIPFLFQVVPGLSPQAHLWHDARITLRDHALGIYNSKSSLQLSSTSASTTTLFLNPNYDLESIRLIKTTSSSNNSEEEKTTGFELIFQTQNADDLKRTRTTANNCQS